MLTNKTAPILVLVIGLGLLGASLLADVIGIGDDPGFGIQQTTGTIVGAIITAVGLYLVRKADRRPQSQFIGSSTDRETSDDR